MPYSKTKLMGKIELISMVLLFLYKLILFEIIMIQSTEEDINVKKCAESEG